jgi:hypothetical protein
MKISAQLCVFFGAIFAIACFAVAISGFSSLGELQDPVQVSDARGFAIFWAFLGSIGAALGGISWWIAKTQKPGE